MNGPGAFAIDEKGYIWVNDNYIPKAAGDISCAGQRLLKFYPWGENFPGSPYFGGGLEGAGFGITLAPNGHVWVGNFGFEAPACSTPGNSYGVPATNNSVSEFRPDGTPVSQDVTGYTEGAISWPQSTVADKSGSIWLANCGSDSVTLYPQGSPDEAVNLADIGVEKPFGLAIGSGGNAWVVGNKSNSLAVLGPDGDLLNVISGTINPTHPRRIPWVSLPTARATFGSPTRTWSMRPVISGQRFWGCSEPFNCAADPRWRVPPQFAVQRRRRAHSLGHSG